MSDRVPPRPDLPPDGAPVPGSMGARLTDVEAIRSVPANITCVPRAAPSAAGFQ